MRTWGCSSSLMHCSASLTWLLHAVPLLLRITLLRVPLLSVTLLHAIPLLLCRILLPTSRRTETHSLQRKRIIQPREELIRHRATKICFRQAKYHLRVTTSTQATSGREPKLWLAIFGRTEFRCRQASPAQGRCNNNDSDLTVSGRSLTLFALLPGSK